MKNFDIDKIRKNALRAISAILPANKDTKDEPNFIFNAKRTEAGRKLPPYYLTYFLLVELLQFRNLGQHEKVAWSVPIDYLGDLYLIEYRKMGLGVFTTDVETKEAKVKKIVNLICRGVIVAEPYFEYIASKAVAESKINVINKSSQLFDRYDHFLREYKTKILEAEQRKDESIRAPIGKTGYSVHFPGLELRKESYWLAIATIDAFFSWTEHVFIHIALLLGKISTGNEVANLAESDWANKFKYAIDISIAESKYYYELLLDIRRQFRNIITHGAFGKNGEAFSFHSGTGAVPVFLPHKAKKQRFSISKSITFKDREIINTIEAFIIYIWSGELSPAKLYIESGHPIILPMVADGSYKTGMKSTEDMEDLLLRLGYMFDQAANMDW